MALRYTAQQLLNLKQNYRLQKDAYELCRNAGLLRQRRYLHRSVGRSYCLSTSNNICMPTSRRQTKRASYTGAVLGNLSSLVRSELLSVVRQSPVNVALFNARSVNNKALLLSDIITDRKLDLLFLTESWHKQNDGLLFNQITPEGYGLFDLPRLTGRGGGIIVVYNLQFTFTFIFMHLADGFIQSDLHCIKVTVSTFYQLLLSLGIEPMILALLATCSTS